MISRSGSPPAPPRSVNPIRTSPLRAYRVAPGAGTAIVPPSIRKRCSQSKIAVRIRRSQSRAFARRSPGGGMAPEEPRDVIWMRPEHAATGRPAQRSRAEITAAAVTIADREGLDAVSMRRVAAELGTGAASLYRYVDNREDLLDLMSDAVGAEYELAGPTGDWRADLVSAGEQMRAIMLRHPWLASLLPVRAALGPHGVALLEYVLTALAEHPAEISAKLEAFAMMTAMAALFVQ